MSNGIDKRALFEALKQDAARIGIPVEELIRRITSGAHVLGAAASRTSREMLDSGRVHMSSGEGNMPQIEDRLEPDEEDDFTDLLQRREQALLDAGGDDLAREALLLHGDRSTFADDAVHINPKSAVGAILGQTVSVQSGDDPKTVAYWTGDDSEATDVTCTISPGIALAQAGDLAVDVDPFARITWGTRAQQVTADVDVGRGCQLTVAGSSVIVRVGMSPTLPAGAGNATMSLAAMLSFREITHPVPVTRTLSILGLGAGLSTVLSVPAFAKRFRVYRGNAAVAATIAPVNYSNGQIYSFKMASSANGEPFVEAYVLPNNAASLSIQNNDGVLQLNAKIVFDLAL